MKLDRTVLGLSVLLALFLHVVDSLIDALVFGEETILAQLTLAVPVQELYFRLITATIVLGFGVFASYLVAKGRRAEMRLDHLSRVLKGVRAVNQLLSREMDPGRLLAESCSVLVDTRGYFDAWIGLAQEGRSTGECYHAGFGQGFERMAEVLRGGELPTCGREAMEGGDVVVPSCRPEECSVCSVASPHPEGSRMTTPLRHLDRTLGWITVTVPREFAHDPEEAQALREVGVKLGRALDTLEASEKAKREREKVARVAQEGEERFRELAELLPEAVFEADAEVNLTYANRRAFELLGYSQEDFEAGLNGLDMIVPEERNQAVESMKDRFGGKDPGITQYTAIRKDGTRFPVLFHAATIVEDGRPVGLRGVIVDISQRESAAEALRESEERFRNVIEQSNDGIYILFEDRLDLVNQRFCDLHGITREEALSPEFRLWDFLTPASKPILEERTAKRARGEPVPSVYTFAIQNRPGDIVKVQTSVTEIDYRGGRAVLGFVRDVSDQKELEAQLLQAQKMESVGRLSGGIAHDLNNLLTPIIGFGEMLAEDEVLDSVQRDSAVEIVRAAFRAKDLVRQLLAFGRRQTLEFEPMDLNRMITEFEPLLRRTIREDIQIRLELDSAVPVILGDRGQLEQVIMNLAINARDAMTTGGELVLATSEETLTDEDARSRPGAKAGRYVTVSMRDTGVGMDEDVKARVFEPFFTTKEVGSGTGLGLAMVYGIVKQHGGNIWVESERGSGSVFRCYFPVAEALVLEEGGREELPTATGGSEVIMVVEDEDLVRNLTVTVLRRRGYQVLEAADPEDCLARLQNRSGGLDLLLTDVVMPGMNGRDLYERVSSSFPGVKVLFMSGYSADVVSHEGILDEGIAFLPKPFSVNTLISRVREALDEG